jgi:cardiolipin synthase
MLPLPRLCLSPLLALLLAGCVSAPPVNLAALRAPPPTSEADSMAQLRQDAARIAGRGFIAGNQVTLLTDGPATYAAMTQAIQGARREIDLESYEFDRDEGARFADLLMARRRAGVRVHLVYDAWGSLDTPETLFERMRAEGIEVVEYSPLTPDKLVDFDINKRDHRKLLVVDGRVAITGGVNITRAYRNRLGAPAPGRDMLVGQSDDPDRMVWRDTDVRITGPAVAQFQSLFLATWQGQHGPPLPPSPATPATPDGPARVLAVDGAPPDEHPLIYQVMLAAITLARHSIHLTTGFFAPTAEMDEALAQAARRGVDVTIMVPAHSTSTAAIAAGRSHYAALLDAGVHIDERDGVVLHAKTLVVDGAIAAVGSANFDWRSAVWNNEIDALVDDATFAGQLDTLFAQDVARSSPVDPALWRDRSWGEQMEENVAKLLERLL